MIELTEKQKEFLLFMMAEQKKIGTMPSLRWLAEKYNVSVGTVVMYIKALLSKGYLIEIKTESGRRMVRGILLSEKCDGLKK